jgi:hypothetical protein
MFYHKCHWLYCDYFCFQDHKDVLPQLSLIVLWLFLLSGSQRCFTTIVTDCTVTISVIRITKMFYHNCHWLYCDNFCYQNHRCFTTSFTNCTVTISVIRITDVLSHFVTNCTVTISAIRITKMFYHKCHWLYCDYFCYQCFRMFLLPFYYYSIFML